MKILFVSNLDFKQKSIQVIRKTPEFYVQGGHQVTYVTYSDRGSHGDYFYEQVFNPDGIEVTRLNVPLDAIVAKIRNSTVRTIAQKLRMLFLFVPFAAYHAWRLGRTQVADIVYGYEVYGVLAGFLANMFLRKPFVSRFQGTKLVSCTLPFRWKGMITKIDEVIAVRLPTDLMIMTDDGTRGDEVMRTLRCRPKRFLFLRNGVDRPNEIVTPEVISETRGSLSVTGDKLLVIAVSRLITWKRVDRIIHAVRILAEKIPSDKLPCFRIFGDGAEAGRLRSMVDDLGLEPYVTFVGAVPNEALFRIYHAADLLVSTYDMSNLGNPLLEAQVCGLPVLTLDNGATATAVRHGQNGLLVDHTLSESEISAKLAEYIESLCGNPLQLKALGAGARMFAEREILPWAERLKVEMKAVESLVRK